MREVRPRKMWLAMALICATACEPIYVLPGGALSGSEHPAPDDWRAADSEEVLQLEVRPAAPYSVNIWGVGLGPHYYVLAAPGAAWAEMVAEEPRVRLRIAGRIYPLSAFFVGKAEELEAVVAAYVAKYDMDPEEDIPPGVAVYRLEPR